MTNWREFAVDLLAGLDELSRQLDSIGAYPVAIDETAHTITWLADDVPADEFLTDPWEAGMEVDTFIVEWRRRLWSAEIVADRTDTP